MQEGFVYNTMFCVCKAFPMNVLDIILTTNLQGKYCSPHTVAWKLKLGGIAVMPKQLLLYPVTLQQLLRVFLGE